MKKKLLIAVLTLLLAFSCAVLPAAQSIAPVMTAYAATVTDGTVKVKVSAANIRKGAGTNYAKVATAKKGKTFTVCGSKSVSGTVWYKIKYSSSANYWICSTTVTYSKPASTTAAAGKIGTVKVTASSLNLRKGAGTNYAKAASVSKGKVLDAYGSTKVSGVVWYKVKYNSSYLWLCGTYVTYTAAASTTASTTKSTTKSTTTTTTGKTTGSTAKPTTAPTSAVESGTVTITGSTVNVRKGAGTSYGKVTTVKKGSKYTYSETKKVSGVTWYHIKVSSSVNGWISGDYASIVTTPPVDDSKIKTSVTFVTISKSSVNIRKGAGTSYAKVATASSGAKYPVISSTTVSGTVWYKIIYTNNTAAWVCSTCVTKSTVTSTVNAVASSKDTSKPCHVWKKLKVKVDAAVLYSDSKTSSTPLAIITKGQEYLSYGAKGGSDDVSWYKINVGGVEGYVSRKLFTVTNVYDPIPDRDFTAKTPVIYLSPSKQSGNPYKTGGTNEKVQMEAVAAVLYEKLKAYNCEVYVATPTLELEKRAVEAYEKNADIYIAIHSNATGNSTARYGANAYYFPGCAQSKEYAESVIESLNKVNVFGHQEKQLHDGMAYTDNFGYAEVREPGKLGMISILVETEYHDNKDSSDWIINHHEEMAEGLLESIVRTLKLTPKNAEEPEQEPEQEPEAEPMLAAAAPAAVVEVEALTEEPIEVSEEAAAPEQEVTGNDIFPEEETLGNASETDM